MLEIADGSRLVQSNAIMNYLGNTYGLKPKDAILIHRGESFEQRFAADYQYKYFNWPVWYAPNSTKAPFMKTLFE